ncbi:MAG: UbiA-like polyprenyltransferase [Deltaproteobacteria bacterium]|nr:UbiA-like polyprenyltransferase [Deltaproteobacteria bacterium]
MSKLRDILSLIKFSHSIFALPFALASMLVGAEGIPPLKTILLIIAAMVFARSAAMSFNRWADAIIDAKNPRTRIREIPQGKLKRQSVLNLTLLFSVLFIVTTFFINRLCFFLSPVALFIIFFYSMTKRWTSLSHLFLGLSLGVAPIGAWIAVTGEWSWIPVVLGLAVLFWVAGFDIIYATQDLEFDKTEGLHSLVVRLGLKESLFLSRVFHGVALLFFVLFGMIGHLGLIYFVTILGIGFFLTYEHSLVKPEDLSHVNAAFFTMNGIVSILFLVGTVLSRL